MLEFSAHLLTLNNTAVSIEHFIQIMSPLLKLNILLFWCHLLKIDDLRASLMLVDVASRHQMLNIIVRVIPI